MSTYQIRSALDHLTFDLVKLNPNAIQLPANWVRRCEFPLLTEIPAAGNPPSPRDLPLPFNYFRKTLPGITEQAFTFIEGLQPYYRRNAANQLRLLAQLSNIDKHRHLNVISPQAYRREVTVFENGVETLTIRRTEAGAELESLFPPEMMPARVKVQRGFIPFVTFAEATLGKGPATLPVDHVLELCVDVAEKVIVPAFEKFLDNP